MMTNDDFKSLATRYLEDSIEEDDLRQLNRALLESPERVQQFNDLRLLVGMIMEHGRSERKLPSVLHSPLPERKHARPRPWLSATALIAIGLLVGFLLGRPWSGERDSRPDPVDMVTADKLIDGGFEKAESIAVAGYPERAGQWTGDAVRVSLEKNTEIQPFEGSSMLCLALRDEDAPAPRSTSTPQRAVQWQIVDIGETDATSATTVAELRARFNGHTEGASAEWPCRVELYALRGRPETAQSQLESGSYLASASRQLHTDDDPQTWELAETSLRVPPEADFLLIGISGIGERIPQPFGDGLAGHYADGIDLKLYTPK